MATVRIGDRDLEVERATLGFSKYKLRPWRALSETLKEEEQEDHTARWFHLYVGHHEGVTLEWLLANVPADPTELMRMVVVASGQKLAPGAPTGEASRP